MAGASGATQHQAEPDRDQVDFTWLVEWLRRRGILHAPAPRRTEQLTLFGPPPRTARPWPVMRLIRQAMSPVAEAEALTASRHVAARCVFVGATLLYMWLFAAWTTRHHDGLGTQAFDFGIYDQGLWLLSRFERPFITVMGRHLFGDHTSFILLPLVPIYWVIPSGKVLLVAQALALGLGAVPTFLLARHVLRHEMLAALLAVAYLLHPTLAWVNLEQFHPDVFEVPLALFAIWFMVQERWRPYAACVVALLLVKEDAAVLTLALGVYAAVKHDRKVGLFTVAGSLLYAAAAFWWILPALNGVGTLNAWRIPFGGPWGLVQTTITHPGRVIAYLTERDRLWYVWQLFAPLGFLAFAAPGVLLIGIGALASNLLSTFGYQYDIQYHYTTLIYPVVVAATIFGIAQSAPSLAGRKLLTGCVLLTSVVTAYLWGPTPLGRYEFLPADPNGAQVQSFHRAVQLLPEDAPVSAFYGWLPQLTHRKEAYMFPNPWKASYWGTFKHEGKRLPEADGVRYIVLPSQLDPEPKAVLDGVRGEFEVIYDEDGVVLFKRKP